MLKSLDRPGRPEVIPEGSEKSLALQSASQDGPKGYRKTFPKLAQDLGIKAARSTIERVMHNHHNIHRFSPNKPKPALNMYHKEARMNYAYWAMRMHPRYLRFYLSVLLSCGIQVFTLI